MLVRRDGHLVSTYWFGDMKTLKDFGAIGDGVADDTAAIQAAIDSGYKDLYASQGRYKITSTIRLGTSSTLLRSVRLRGVGFDELTAYAGTAFVWAGTSGGVMMEACGAQQCQFSDFLLDGAGTAGTGLRVTCLNATGSGHFSVFERLWIREVVGSPGIGLDLDGDFYATDQDIAANYFRNIHVFHSVTAFRQRGIQTAANVLEDCHFFGGFTNGLYLEKGDARVSRCSFYGDTTAVNDVYVGLGMLGVVCENNYHEVFSAGPGTRRAYYFPAGNRVYHSSLNGNRILYALPSGQAIYYGQWGPLTINGGAVEDASVSGAKTLEFDATSAGGAQGAVLTQVFLGATFTINTTASMPVTTVRGNGVVTV